MKRLSIATRRSPLALWQAGHIKARLQELHPELDVRLVPMTTRGDELIDRRLDEAGGKGLFVKELENAIADGRADLAVHSMKDVPAELPPGFVLAAITAREDPRDAFVSNRFPDFAAMPAGAVVGTSSLRRSAQIVARHPALAVRLLRGNVETRLGKLDRGEYDAIVLAVAGLARLGMQARITRTLEVDTVLPAPGQGALGMECLGSREDLIVLLSPLADDTTTACVRAERAVSRALGGSCALPLGAYAELRGERIRLRALVASNDGLRVAHADCEGDARDPERVAERAVADLRAAGAGEILERLK
jgi:hydroxymethylbilane synthase